MLSLTEFVTEFDLKLKKIQYEVHPKYSVFTQYDKQFYLSRKEKFIHKYKCFSTITSILKPNHIIELGTCAASAAHAYLYDSRNSFYTGYDVFGSPLDENNNAWNSYEIAFNLLNEMCVDFKLYKENLRNVKELSKADFVVVDADHSFDNAYKDCLLSLTADPQYIFIDDYSNHVVDAVKTFQELNKSIIDWTHIIKYVGNGYLIKFK